jgi:hypothetical protein
LLLFHGTPSWSRNVNITPVRKIDKKWTDRPLAK